MSYVIRKFDEVQDIQTPFGTVKELTTRRDSTSLNMAHVSFSDDRRHYHREATEIYYILKGRGEIELDSEVEPVEPGTAVLIHPNTRHRIRAHEGRIDFLVVSSPPYNPQDEFYD